MILTRKDLEGSIQDKPEYGCDYSKNYQAFVAEFEDLKKCAPSHPGWSAAIFSFKIYKDELGYRIALPMKCIPHKIKGLYFQDYFITNTIFPNQYQAADTAALIVRALMGH